MHADALAPFQPALSLELIEGLDAPAGLMAALLMGNGRMDESRYMLEKAIERGEARQNPELYLFLSNAEQGDPGKKLVRLNAYLEAASLPPVRLCDSLESPSPMNLQPAVELPGIDGPLVSVLMTAYQSGQYIDTAIRSIMQQTWRNIELIVIDDASSDTTADIVRSWCAIDNRIRSIRLPCNVGTFIAKNIGLRFASGDFVTCHDSDDWSHPLKIERQVVPLLRDRSLVGTISDWVRMQEDGIFYARSVHPLRRLNPSSLMFHRNAVLSVAGSWDCVRTGADSEFIARLKLVFGRKAVLRIKQPLSFGAHRPDSLMTSPETGYGSCGMSPSRLAYWEAWSFWHIDSLRRGCGPKMPSDMPRPRPFAVDDFHLVPDSDVQHCLDCLHEARCGVAVPSF